MKFSALTPTANSLTQRYRPERFDPWLPWLIWFLPFVLFGNHLLTGQAIYWGTPELQFIPWRWYAWENLRQGILPLWNHLNGMGAPLAANYQLALFYPPGWLLYVFAAIGGAPLLAWGHTLLAVLHLGFSGWGMAKLVRMLRGTGLAQTIAGMSFSLGGYLVARMGFSSMIWTAAWMPWIILYASQISMPVRTSQERAAFPQFNFRLTVCLALMLLAGHAQLSWYILIFISAWVIIGAIVQYELKEIWRPILVFGCTAVLAVGFAAIQIIPTAEYLMQSQRSGAVDTETMLAYSYWPWRLITLFAPDAFGNPGTGNYWGYASQWEDALYVGLLPMIMALRTLKQVLKPHRDNPNDGSTRPLLIFLWCFVFAGFLFGMGKFTPVFPFLANHIPTFDMFHGPARILIWVAFSFSLLAGLGIDTWNTPSGRGLYWLRLATMGGAAVTVGAFFAWIGLQGIHNSLIRSFATAGIWSVGIGLLTLFMPQPSLRWRYPLWMILVLLWTSIDLFIMGWRLNPGIPISFFEPNNHLTFSANQLMGRRIYLGIEDEYRLKFSRFLRFSDYQPIENSGNIRSILLPNLNLLDGIPAANNFDPLVPGRYSNWMEYIDTLDQDSRQPWLAMMGVSFEEIIRVDTPLGVEFRSVPNSRRVSWHHCSTGAENGETSFALLKEIIREDPMAAQRILIVEGENISQDECDNGSDQAQLEILAQSSQHLTILVDSETEGWVMVPYTWYPGWEAAIDGQLARLWRANYLFQAVQIPAGRHILNIYYSARIYWIGAIFSALTLFLCLGVFLQYQKGIIFHRK